jgi:hypothetical protein
VASSSVMSGTGDSRGERGRRRRWVRLLVLRAAISAERASPRARDTIAVTGFTTNHSLGCLRCSRPCGVPPHNGRFLCSSRRDLRRAVASLFAFQRERVSTCMRPLERCHRAHNCADCGSGVCARHLGTGLALLRGSYTDVPIARSRMFERRVDFCQTIQGSAPSTRHYAAELGRAVRRRKTTPKEAVHHNNLRRKPASTTHDPA